MPASTRSLRKPLAILFLCGATLACLPGCSGKGSVSGKVTVNGAPLKGGGSITFQPPGKPGASGTINEDGTYMIANVPTGEVVVTLVSGLRQTGAGRSLNNIPKKYADANTSGLTATIKGGENTVDLPLTSP